MCEEEAKVGIIARSSGPEKMKPACEKHKRSSSSFSRFITKMFIAMAEPSVSASFSRIRPTSAAFALAKFALDSCCVAADHL